jgi:hypothetical protein
MHRYTSMGGIVPFHRIHSWKVHQTQLPPPNQWLASCPPTALKNKKHSSGSSHTNPLLHANIQVVRLILIHSFMLIQIQIRSKIAIHHNKMVHHHGYVHLSPHAGIIHVTGWFTSCYIQPHKFKIQMVRPSLIDSRLRPPPHTHSKESSTCTAASQREPNQ